MNKGPSIEEQAHHCVLCLTAQNETQLSRFINEAPTSVAMFDRDLRYLALSRRWRQDFHLETDVFGRSHYEIFPDLPKHWKDCHRRGLEGESIAQDRELFVRADGSQKWLRWELRPWRGPRGDVGGIVIYLEDVTETVVDQDRIRQSEARLRAVGDNLPDSSVFQYARDASGTPCFHYLSAGTERITGIPAEEAIADAGKLFSQLLPEYLPLLFETEAAATAKLADYDVEAPFRRADGEMRWMRLRARPDLQPDGRIFWNGVQTDITESRLDRERLRESEATLRAMGDNLPDSAVFRWTRDSSGVARYLHISAGVEKLTGLTVEQIVADENLLAEQVLPDYRATFEEAENVARRQLSDFSAEAPFRRADGEVRWMRISSRPDPQPNGQIFWNGVLTDITEGVVAQDKVRRSEARLRALGDSLPDSAIVQFELDSHGLPRFLYLSAGFGKITGLAVEDVLANRDVLVAQILPQDLPKVLTAQQAALRDLADLAVEVQFQRADGEARWMRLHARPDRQPDGRLLWNGVQTDITDERMRQAAQREAAIRNSFRLELADAIKPQRDPSGIVAVVSERLGKRLGCNQVVYAEVDANEEFATVKHEWTDGKMPTSVGVHKVADYGLGWVEDLRAGRISAVENVATDPRAGAESATSNGLSRRIGAFLRAPLIKDGKVVTVLSAHHREPRRWSAMDISLVEDAAERTWSAIERLRAEDALRDSEERLRFALRAAGAGAWDWDVVAGKMIWSAEAWAIYGLAPNGREATFETWLETVHPEDRAGIVGAAQESVAGGGEISIEWRTGDAGEAQRWLMSRGGPTRNPDGSITRYTGVVIDITERKKSEERAGYLALHDALTGLPNRAAFNERMGSAIAEADETRNPVALLCIDLDRFKEANDVFGHSAGDELLRQVSRRFEVIAGDALVARVGGDEFNVLVRGKSALVRASDLAERMCAAVAAPFDINGSLVRSGVSIGVAIYPDHGDAAAVLANADAALYRAKAEGRGKTCFFDSDLDLRLRKRRAILKDLETALDREEFVLHYQPQARGDREIFGFEALLRWRHPGRGLVPPGVFIPIAEESGLIVDLGEWVLREACREAASWPTPLNVSVNLSPKQFFSDGLPRMVHGVLLRSGLAPHQLELEITETVLIEDFSRVSAQLRQLKALGVKVSMDDFGTGYSSLSYVHSFPFDKIKIDASFVSRLDDNPSSETVIKAIIGLGHGLGVPLIAEGVETEEQLEFLRSAGCMEAQGFLIGAPKPIELYAGAVGRPKGGELAPAPAPLSLASGGQS